MGKNDWKRKENQEVTSEEQSVGMSAEEARAYRVSQYQAEEVKLTDSEKRDEFRKFWAQQKYKYGKSKDLEPILWAHLKATKQDDPAKFEDGVAHFGLKKIQ